MWGPASERAATFAKLLDAVKECPKASTMLRNVASYVTAEHRPSERTTSVIEREMREINRRTDVGARWSVRGVDNLLRLRHSKRINPDDFDRVWRTIVPPAFQTVPLV